MPYVQEQKHTHTHAHTQSEIAKIIEVNDQNHCDPSAHQVQIGFNAKDAGESQFKMLETTLNKKSGKLSNS